VIQSPRQARPATPGQVEFKKREYLFMRFKVAAKDHYLVFHFTNAEGLWNAASYAVHEQTGAANAECKAIRVLNCVGRASLNNGAMEWAINRDDVSFQNVIDLCLQISLVSAPLNNHEVIARVFVVLPKLLGYKTNERRQQVRQEAMKSFYGNAEAQL
jgi:hypothetical protein